MAKSYEVSIEIAGYTAMWTRPDTGDCPVSYPAPTYSACKAIFESILWGPAVTIIPTKVEICSPIQYHSYFTNYGGPLRKNDLIKKSSSFQLLATVLIDVCYRLYADVLPSYAKDKMPDRAKQWDVRTTSPGHAYKDIFCRRLKHGQCYSVPFLGWKEFTPSYFGNFRESTQVLKDLKPVLIPSMLKQIFPNGYNSSVEFAYLQNLVINNGVLCFSENGSKK